MLDFDLCGPGWRAYDVASFVQACGEAFIEGYASIRGLSDVESAALPAFEGVDLESVGAEGRALATAGESE